jgi:ABC-type multidrug transport system fused ATPase/permease subunit
MLKLIKYTLKPLLDIFHYFKIFQIYLGKRMYLIFLLSIVASLLEGLGILMLLPLLETLDGSVPQNLDQSQISGFLFNVIEFIGLSSNITSILLLISISFTIKGLVVFSALAFNAFLSGELLKELKIKLFKLYSGMKYSYYSSKNTGELLNIINEQPARALEAFRQITLLISHIINTIILLFLAFLISTSFGSLALTLGLILLILFLKLNKYVQSLSRILAKENGVFAKWLIQSLHGFKYLVSTNQIGVLKKKVDKSISILTSAKIKGGVASAFTQSVREPIAVVFIMIIVFVQVFIYGLMLEPILVSIALFYRALGSTLGIQTSFQGTYKFIGSMELVHHEFLNQQVNQSNNGVKEIGQFNGSIKFDNVNFSYGDTNQKTLQSISFIIPHKSSTAFVGESGSGKTTIVDLITLTNEGYEGEITIDGIKANKIDKPSWRKNIGYVSQDTLIFDDTIANNISMWTEDYNAKVISQIREAADQANILDFIESLPDGLNTIVGDRGMLLSGGQRQRIFIARELFRKPNILILDEATSALDSESEKSIQESIESLKGTLTVIIIAHRLSTIKNVDQIYFIDKGKVVEQGTYDILKNNSKSKFSKLINLQVL